MDTPYLPAAPENSSKWKTHCLHYFARAERTGCHGNSHLSERKRATEGLVLGPEEWRRKKKMRREAGGEGAGWWKEWSEKTKMKGIEMEGRQ